MINKIVTSKRFLFGYGAVFLCAPFPGLWQIRIHPKFKNDAGLIAHENEHLRGYKKQPWTYAIKMMFSESFRLAEEVRCYRVQLRHSANVERDRLIFAGYIANNYMLRVTQEEALKLLF